tara:strand:- start:85 stop:300 length:216 start_codon:yes stop_codon:yes gene_type:complete
LERLGTQMLGRFPSSLARYREIEVRLHWTCYDQSILKTQCGAKDIWIVRNQNVDICPFRGALKIQSRLQAG